MKNICLMAIISRCQILTAFIFLDAVSNHVAQKKKNAENFSLYLNEYRMDELKYCFN